MKLRWICAFAVATLGLVPVSASALTIETGGDVDQHEDYALVTAAPGETNDLRISVDPDSRSGGIWRFRDESAPITDVYSPCTSVSVHEVTCEHLSGEDLALEVDLGDGDDRVTLPAAANGSFFKDFSVIGNTGNDTIVGG